MKQIFNIPRASVNIATAMIAMALAGFASAQNDTAPTDESNKIVEKIKQRREQEPKEQTPYKASATRTGNGVFLYSMKYDGGYLGRFQAAIETAFPDDNFIYTQAATDVELPAFEIRHVRLAELARSIAFLSEGKLSVDVVEKDGTMPGNIWRISVSTPPFPTSVKMRAVAAPHLLADKERFLRWFTEVRTFTPATLEIRPLTGQKVIVLFGKEVEIAGMESLIKASEETMADEDEKDLERRKTMEDAKRVSEQSARDGK